MVTLIYIYLQYASTNPRIFGMLIHIRIKFVATSKFRYYHFVEICIFFVMFYFVSFVM